MRCGSEALSTPAAPPGVLSRWAQASVLVATVTLILLTLTTVAVGLFVPIPWALFGRRLALLAFEVLALFLSSTLLPGPVSKIQGPPRKSSRE